MAGGGWRVRLSETISGPGRGDGRALTNPKPPLVAELIWTGGVTFGATSGSSAIVIDSEGLSGPSPMQAVAMALGGCMAIDVVTILQKSRHPLKGLRVVLSGERADQPPRRFTRIALNFHVSGEVGSPTVERAIALSRETYCSVWHSLRQDVDLAIRFEIHP